MTDKEWKELCEWAHNYSDKIFLDVVSGVCYGIEINHLKFNKYGEFNAEIYNYNMYVNVIIAKNLTSQQIKAIIENLL